MSVIRDVLYRLRAVFARGRLDAELDEELRFHIERETEKLIRGEGLDSREARRRALVAFGGVEQARERTRDAWGVRPLEDLAKDVRYALRGIRRSPVFAGTLVLVLGLGIGVTAAMFSVVDALLLRPLPYDRPEELVEVQALRPGAEWARPVIAWEKAGAWSEAADFLAEVVPHARRSVLFLGGAEPLTLTVEAVTSNFVEALGVRPAIGRGFADEDADPAAAATVILSHGFWRSAFGADPGVVGRTIALDGMPHRVIGVMPEGFKFPTYATTEAWVPLRRDGTVFGGPVGSVYLLGRIGQRSPEAAQANADALAVALDERMPRDDGWTMRLVPFREAHGANPDARRAMWFLSGAVALILLIAAVNGIHLLLVRAWARSRELAVRRALGASRGRLVRQMLTESGLLALASGVVAVIAAVIALHAVRGIMPSELTFFTPHAIEIERRTLAFTFAVAAGAGFLVGLIPAIRATRRGPAAAGGRLTPYAATTPARSRLRRALVVGEVALSVVLLVGAGLFIRSFAALTSVDPGYRVEDIVVLKLSLSSESYPTSERRGAFIQRLDERLEALPGVEGVAAGAGIPPAYGLSFAETIETEDGGPVAGDAGIIPSAYAASDFFDVLDVRIVAGRALTEEDVGTDGVIIDRDFANFLWSGGRAVGRRFRIGENGEWLTVVGLVDDLAMMGPDDRDGRFAIIYPDDPARAGSFESLAIRVHGDAEASFAAIRNAVHEVDPRQPITELATARSLYVEEIDMPRFLLVLMTILGGLALVLTATGIAGVLAFGVTRRRHELGVRIALGARPAGLARAVLREGVALTAVGTVLGVGAALASARVIRSLLFRVEPTDATTLAAVVVVSIAAAAAACYWPARRATRVDPVKVLKTE